MTRFWIAIVVLAALLPMAPIVLCAFALIAIGVVLFAATTQLESIEDRPRDVQPVALLALSLFRAPPARA